MLLLFFIVSYLLSWTSSFNFDLYYPIVIEDQFDKSESHFGAALTLVNSKTGPGWYLKNKIQINEIDQSGDD